MGVMNIVAYSLGQNKMYGCEVSRADHLERREGGGFDPQEYIEFPERYISTFSKKIAPYASVIVNGIYWAVGSPKLLTIPDAKTLLRPANTPWLPYSLGINDKFLNFFSLDSTTFSLFLFLCEIDIP